VAYDERGNVRADVGAQESPTQVAEAIAAYEAEMGEPIAAAWAGDDLWHKGRGDRGDERELRESKLREAYDDFIFTNNSTNPSEIATTYYSFSDGNSFLEYGTDTLLHIFPEPNQYSVTMTITSIYGCVYEDSFINIVNVKPLPTADFTFSSNPATFFETTIQLQDRSSADVIDWQWFSPGSNPSYSSSTNPVFIYPEGVIGEYPVTLVVTTEYGCSDTVTLIMNVVQDVIFYAPNTFTPDGDEHNQSWGIHIGGLDIYNFELLIFNRWGELIWESRDPSVSWDGTYKGQIVPEGTYVWRASAKDAINDGKYEFNGYINVMR
jgi:gliding motility-associated-like protein